MTSEKDCVIEGHPIQRVPRSMFWFAWAGRSFDVRYVRELLGLAPVQADDLVASSSPIAIAMLFEPILARAGDRSLAELIDLHDDRSPSVGELRSLIVPAAPC